MRGFTLLEVMIALAIMGGVLLTVIGSFNYHLSIVDRDVGETEAVILGRAKLDDPGFRAVDGEKGTFAPDRPDISWEEVVEPTDYPGVNRVSLMLSRDSGQRKVELVRYMAK